MSDLLNELENWGCDISGSMERFLNDEELYVTCLEKVIDDPAYTQLGEQLEAGNVKAAFDAAHTIKGVVANMGLTPLFDQVVTIVEPLRAGNGTGLEQNYKDLLALNEKLRGMMSQYQ